MLADISESEWILDRLCESLNRYTRKQASDVHYLFSQVLISIAPSDTSQNKRHTFDTTHERSFNINDSEGLHRRPNSSEAKRQAFHDEHHIEVYPAHPGPRSPHHIGGLKSPVLSRGPSGDEVVRISKGRTAGEEEGSSGSGSASTTASASRLTAVGSRDEKRG